MISSDVLLLDQATDQGSESFLYYDVIDMGRLLYVYILYCIYMPILVIVFLCRIDLSNFPAIISYVCSPIVG